MARAGIDREEQPGIAQMRFQFLARDAGLDLAIHVLGVDREDALHPREIQADTPKRGIEVPFQRRADAERNNRRAAFAAQIDDFDDFLGAFRKDHRSAAG